MDKGSSWIIVVLLSVLVPLLATAWRSSIDDDIRDRRDMRRAHYHTKRHMLPGTEPPSLREKRRSTTTKPREIRERDLRKKPSGHLTPLEEDDMENEEVVSVAIGPPPIRPKYEKSYKKTTPKKTPGLNNTETNTAASNLVKDVLTQLGREFLTKEVNENFIFGQYVGNSMKNLTIEHRLGLQHEILELIVKYQKKNQGIHQVKEAPTITKESKVEKKVANTNETEEGWPDFTNLEKIVG